MPGFVGGLAEGLGSNGGIGDALAAIVQRKQQEKLAQARINEAVASQQPPPQAGPAPHPTAALAALGGGGPPQAGPAPFTPGKPPVPGQPGPLAPLPPQAPPPGAPTGAPGAEAPTGMSVNPALADPVKEAQSLNHNLITSMMKANPKLDPLTIIKAVESQIEDIKGVAPLTKAVMQGQLQYMNFNMKSQQFNEREGRLQTEHMEKLMELSQHHANQDAVAAENARFRGEMTAIAKERADYYGESVDYQHEDRQAAESGRDSRAVETNDTRRYVSDTSNQTRRDISGDRSGDSTYRADQSFRGNQVRSGQDPGPAPERPAPRAGSSKRTATVKGPDDIRKLPSGTHWVSADGKRHGVAP